MHISSTLSTNITQWVSKLKSSEYNQEHIIEECNSEDKLNTICDQLDSFENDYYGGLLGYLENIRTLLDNNTNKFKLYNNSTPGIPFVEKLETGSESFCQYENKGFLELSKTVFVLVAGGLGERLESQKIKLSITFERSSNTTFLKYYSLVLLACENYLKQDYGIEVKIPLVIMTSDSTHTKTLEYLYTNDYFGLNKDQIYVLKQIMVPAITNISAKLSLITSDQLMIEKKPHGHGDVHKLLLSSHLLDKWLTEKKKWILFFQDTNILVVRAFCSLIGVASEYNLAMNYLAVPRKPGEHVGSLCRIQLGNTLKTERIVNVEYNILQELLELHGLETDIADPLTGYSQFPGNTNVFVLNLIQYEKALVKNHGIVPEFINPKFSHNKIDFKTSARLECLMQDIAFLLDDHDKIGVTEMNRWACFSCLKNNDQEALIRLSNGLPPDSLFSTESDFYYANSKILEIATQSKQCIWYCGPQLIKTYNNISYPLGPRIVLFPSFGITFQHIIRKIGSNPISISSESTLILDGNMYLDGLSLNGTLIIKNNSSNQLIMKNLSIRNMGWRWIPYITKDNNESNDKLYGYSIEKIDQSELIST